MGLTRDEELMLEDYRTSLTLLCHEDNRKSHLFTIFFLVQGALFGFYGLIFTSNTPLATALVVLGMIFSVFWLLVMERMQGFVELRYCQLVQLEAKLGVITTITSEEQVREQGEAQVIERKYELPWYRKLFSISKSIESRLPALIGFFWILLGVGSSLGIF